MEHVVIRRTFSLGRDSFESITIEATGDGQTLETARLCAVKKILELARMELFRVSGAKVHNVTGDLNNQIQLELGYITQELTQLK